MAFVPLTPASMSPVMTQALDQSFLSTPVTNPAGGAVDLSAWFSMTAKITAVNPGPNSADATFGTASGNSAGVITLKTGVTDLATVPPGTANLIIYGKVLVGDDVQILSRGSLTLLAG